MNIGELSEYYALLKLTKDKRVQLLSSKEKQVDCYVEKLYFGATDRDFSWLTDRELNQAIVDFSQAIENRKNKLEAELSELALRVIRECPKTANKADLSLKLNYNNIHDEDKQGFSIKSFMGAKPTLLNASSHTRITFKISNTTKERVLNRIQEVELQNPKTKKGPRITIQSILDVGGKIELEQFESEIFRNNLEFIDSTLPTVISKLVIQHYSGNKSSKTLNELAGEVYESTKLRQVNRKLSELLYQCMAGMTPSQSIEESGNMEGGLIIVKNDLSLSVFSSYSEQSVIKLKRKLLENSFFETPSTKRNVFGSVYEKNELLFLDLVLQVRLNELTE